MRAIFCCVTGLFVLSGCSTIVGFDASSDFQCDAPKGVSCSSITNNYRMSTSGSLPALNPQSPQTKTDDKAAKEPSPADAPSRPSGIAYKTPAPLPDAAAAAPGASPRLSPGAMNAPSTGTPLRTPERMVRVWLVPYEDSDGDMHDQRYIYMRVSSGQWLLESSRDAIRTQYQLVRPLSRNKDAEEEEARPQRPTTAPPLVVPAPPAAQ